MLQAVLILAQAILPLIQKAHNDPEVQALVAALRNLITAHNASPPPTPPVAS